MSNVLKTGLERSQVAGITPPIKATIRVRGIKEGFFGLGIKNDDIVGLSNFVKSSLRNEIRSNIGKGHFASVERNVDLTDN